MVFLQKMEPESETELEFVKRTIVALARLDDFIATAVLCFRNDGTSKVGGHRQKLYHGTFTSLVPKAYFQLVRTIQKMIQLWPPDEFSIS